VLSRNPSPGQVQDLRGRLLQDGFDIPGRHGRMPRSRLIRSFQPCHEPGIALRVAVTMDVDHQMAHSTRATLHRGANDMQVRRAVTGHDPGGRAVVQIGDVIEGETCRRPGTSAAVIWTSEGFPVDNTRPSPRFDRLRRRHIGRDRHAARRGRVGSSHGRQRRRAARGYPQLGQPQHQPCTIAFVLVDATPSRSTARCSGHEAKA
jgi:hypothetical protein